jgi:hypothetical protein
MRRTEGVAHLTKGNIGVRRFSSYLLVPLMPGLLLGVSQSGAGRWMPEAASIVYWIIEWLIFWGMAFAYTRALTNLFEGMYVKRWIVIFLGGLASSISWTLLSPWYNQIYVDWITSSEVLDMLLNPRSRLATVSLIQTCIAGSAGAGLSTLATLLFESAGPPPVSPPAPLAQMPEPATGVSGPAPRIIERMPDIRTEDILALEAEDHYVRIHHTQGAKLVHYRFADAVSDMGLGRGIRVHRSFWIANHAIKEISRGRRMEIVLTNGIKVPVSSSFRSSLPAQDFSSDDGPRRASEKFI